MHKHTLYQQIISPLLMVLFIYAFSPACAAVPRPSDFKTLSLQEAIVLALRHNPQVVNAQFKRIVDHFALQIAHEQFWPHYDLTVSTEMPYFANHRLRYDDIQHHSHTIYHLQPKITWKPWWGPEITTSFDQQWGKKDSQTWNISLIQPLLRGSSTRIRRATLLDQIDGEAVSRMQYRQALSHAVKQIIHDYHAILLNQKTIRIRKRQLHRSEIILKNIRLQVRLGHLAHYEISQQRANILAQKLDLMRLKQTLYNEQQTLAEDLGISPESHFILMDQPHNKNDNIPHQATAEHLILSHDMDYNRQKLELRKKQRAVLLAQDQTRWQLDAVVTGSWVRDIPTHQGSSYHLSAGLNAHIPITFNNHKNQQALFDAQIALKQTQNLLQETRQHLIINIHKILNNIHILKNQLHLAQLSIHLNHDNYNHEIKKYHYGLSSELNVSELQDRWLKSVNTLQVLRLHYEDAMVDLQQKLGTLLPIWHISCSNKSL